MWLREVYPHLSDENTGPHTAQLTRTLEQNVSWGTMNHSPCSPDLAPTDSPVALLEREKLSGHSCTSDDVKRAITWMTQQEGTSYAYTCSSLSHAVTSYREGSH